MNYQRIEITTSPAGYVITRGEYVLTFETKEEVLKWIEENLE